MDFQEQMIWRGLCENETYFLKIWPLLSEKLFIEKESKELYKGIKKYFERYKKTPSFSFLKVVIENAKLSDAQFKKANELIEYIKSDEDIDYDWLQEDTIKWVKLRMAFNALYDASEKYQKSEIDTSLGDKINEIVSLSTDEEIGTFLSDIEDRWEKAHAEEIHIPFKIDILNKITKGGLMRGTITCLVSNKSGAGKSAVMCSLASDYLRQGLNVLYISLEMSEISVMERVDANILDISIDELQRMDKDDYCEKYKLKMQEYENFGDLVVKQFPTANANCNHFRTLIKDLSLKKSFAPDVIFVDYLNIMTSTRPSEKDYMAKKNISEELRGLAIETDTILITATQTNRDGLSAGEQMDATTIAESYGIIFVLDMAISIINTYDLSKQGKLLFKQMKNRYRDLNDPGAFVLGMDFARMKLYDVGINTEYNEKGQTNDDEELDVALSNIKTKMGKMTEKPGVKRL